ncbi:ComEA family DNA-binding protein [Pelobium manganitolerans]|uniref:ComEA family DNA-binding protein n=1 Tax=Pelobium manganitolerans TaxID=1842495 RepID=UPI003FA3818B
MYQKLKKYVEISPGEFRGMVVFIVILSLIALAPYVYEKLMARPSYIVIETIGPKLAELDKHKKTANNFNYDRAHEPQQVAELFRFNPNQLPVESWMKLGLSEKQAQSIKNYESKGGRFRSIKDVKKMYAISDEMFARLMPYIDLPEQNSSAKKFDTYKNSSIHKTKAAEVLAINSADSSALTELRGVGPAFASRIIKYRKRLGGFVALAQLKEIYGVDSAKYAQLAPQLRVDAENIERISLNRCTFENVKNFPYLKYKQSTAIIAYRNQHGRYSSVADLNKIAILDAETIRKIAPYFHTDD